ncbi:MAG: Type 1 glutamine amidotransferase-like domain-containing protein [Acidimicrobiia bacterium]
MVGTLALIGGGEFTPPCAAFDAVLLERAAASEVLVLPTAAAFEHPDRVVTRAAEHFASWGATTRPLNVLHRSEAEDADIAAQIGAARFIYITDGSPLHLRGVLKDSAVMTSIRAAWEDGAVLAASGAGATVLCDPMVDPRGGAYTVGIGLVDGLAVFPYHGATAEHLRQRSLDLLASHAILVGIDEATALIRDPDGSWQARGAGVVTEYQDGIAQVFADGERLDLAR